MKNNFPHTAGLYLPAEVYLLRAPALPAHTFLDLSAPLIESTRNTSDTDNWLQTQRAALEQRLIQMSAQAQIQQALAIASPSLYKRLTQIRCGNVGSHSLKKALSSLLRYIIRMSTRPTPFGLFSGVALGFFGEKVGGNLSIPALAKFRTRPDMQWLLTLLQRLEASPALLEQLSFQVNQLAYITGGRLYLPPADPYGQKQSQLLSLRATLVVRKALELAHSPIPYHRLHEALLQIFPGSSNEQVEHLLWQLWKQNVLISTLHPLTSIHKSPGGEREWKKASILGGKAPCSDA